MKEIISCTELLRLKLKKHQKENLNEYSTRTIFIEPLLQALGWDVINTDEVQLEYPTIDGKFVDYALKINHKLVLFIEAKSLNDPLTDVKAITQVVGYAANAGVEWCILTNGVTYKVYKSTEKAEAPKKLFFEVSINSNEKSIQQIAQQIDSFSKDAMVKGVLNEISEEVFTTGKIKKALDKLFLNPPTNLIKIIRFGLGDELIKPNQIKTAIQRLWSKFSGIEISSSRKEPIIKVEPKGEKYKEYTEEYHLKGKPKKTVEIFRAFDKFCIELDPAIQRRYLARYITYIYDKKIFCSVVVSKNSLSLYLKLKFSDLENHPNYVRDISNIGHWGVGNAKIKIDSLEKLETIKSFIRQSFEKIIN